MTQRARFSTAADFVRLWRVLAEADDTVRLEALEAQFPDLAASDPDIVLEIVRTLATSEIHGGKEAAVIYTRFIFRARCQEVTDLLASVYEHGDSEIRGCVLDTIDAITSDPQLTPADAANLITNIKGPKSYGPGEVIPSPS